MRSGLIWAVLALSALSPTAASAGFMRTPLDCGDPGCSFRYSQGVYTPQIMNSVVDHHMARSSSSSPWQYGHLLKGDGSADAWIIAFNGEVAHSYYKSGDDTCVAPPIRLKQGSADATGMTNPSGCHHTYDLKQYVYSSYDDHPGYDYRAEMSTPVRAVAYGHIVSIAGDRCYKTYLFSDSCASWGWIGIDHGNGYVTQYGHLSSVVSRFTPGAVVYQGDIIGYTGKTIPSNRGSVGAHLHFEVLASARGSYTGCGGQVCFVDPYGWVGGGSDPLYSAMYVAPQKLWQ